AGYIVAKAGQSRGKVISKILNLLDEASHRGREIGDTGRHQNLVFLLILGRLKNNSKLFQKNREVNGGQTHVIESWWKTPAQKIDKRFGVRGFAGGLFQQRK